RMVLGDETIDYFMKRNAVAQMAGVKRMIVVRNPLDRLVSVYREKCRGGLPFTCCKGVFGLRLIANANNLPRLPGRKMSITFEQFLRGILKRTDRHWIPMHKFCAPCSTNYDYILKLETFKEDLRNILNALEITEQIESSEVRNNSTKKAGEKKPTESYYRDLPKELLCGVYRTYRMDFLLFDYEIPDFLKEFHDKKTEINWDRYEDCLMS
ncbi:unnamed protein product, partial [Meganyctiphanes norvegica]